jgi:hypothetical protein
MTWWQRLLNVVVYIGYGLTALIVIFAILNLFGQNGEEDMIIPLLIFAVIPTLICLGLRKSINYIVNG